jgi:hypothetical protein
MKAKRDKQARASAPAAAAAQQGDASPKAGEPPAQAGDQVETKVATAQPKVKLPTEAEARAELDAHPERHSVLSQSGHIVRER